MSACRLYLDQSTHHLNSIYGDGSSNVKDIEHEMSIQYDTYLGYRVMEALRNYVQHRGFPIHSITYISKVASRLPGSNILFTLTPYIKVSALEEDIKFKRSVIVELSAVGDKIDIKPLIREYIECLGRIHSKVRELISKDILEWEEIVTKTIDRFKITFGTETSLAGLAVVCETEGGIYNESERIFTDFIEHRRAIERKNSSLESLASRYVTSETLD